MLHASPRFGRVFDTSDEDAVLVSERFARSRFSDGATAIGKRLHLDATTATIVGVMLVEAVVSWPPAFAG